MIVIIYIYLQKLKNYSKLILKNYSTDNGGQLFAKVLKAHGIKNIFVLTGGHVIPPIVSCEKEGIKVCTTRDEQNAVFAAECVGKMTGKPGVCIATAGPGVTNCITALKNAQIEEVPLVFMGGAPPSMLQGRDSLQDMDQIKLLRSVCKSVEKVRTVKGIVNAVRRAMKTAVEGVPGPCFVEIPLDLLYPLKFCLNGKDDLDKLDLHVGVKDKGADDNEKPQKRGIMDIISDLFMTYFIYYCFYNAFHGNDYTPLDVKPVKVAGRQNFNEVAEMLKKAKRPVFLIGSHFMRDKGKDIIEKTANSLRNLKVPYFLTGLSRGLTGFPPHEYSLRHNRTYICNKADLVILFAISPNYKINYGKCFSKSANVISINLNKRTLGLNSPMLWKAAMKINACPQRFMVDLEHTYTRTCPKEDVAKKLPWFKRVTQIDKDSLAVIEKRSNEKTKSGNINHLKLILEMEKHIPDNAIVICDGGNSALTASFLLNARSPLSWVNMMEEKLSVLGVGAGYILAAKQLFPERDVWVLWGDGTVGWSLSEFETYKRLNFKKLACVVCNDGAWGMIQRIQHANYSKDNTGCVIDQQNYHKVIEAYGGEGIRIENDAQVDSGLAEMSIKSKNGFVMLNAIAGRLDYETEGLLKG